MKKIFAIPFLLAIGITSFGQVDTAFIYNNNTKYGSLDIRIAKSPTWYYYLNEGQTFSFRESSPGVKTNTYLDMTSWDSSPYLQGTLREKNGSVDNFVLNYRLLPPKDYNASYANGYPLVLILHGSGERGNCWDNNCYHATRDYDPLINSPAAPTAVDSKLLNNDHNLSLGGIVHLKARNDANGKFPDDPTLGERDFPGFVLYPQDLNGWEGSGAEDAIRIIRLLQKKYNIDPDRIYIEGISNGGHGAYEALKRAPWMFAAAVLMSAVDDGNIIAQKMTADIAHIPLRIFQGALDDHPYPKRTEDYVRQFRDEGAEVLYKKYDNLGHGTWNTAFAEPDFFSWMLKRNKAALHVFGASPLLCNSSGLPLQMAKGFKAYQWEYNGQIISNANAYTYLATTVGTYRARFSRVTNPTEAQWNQWSDPITLTQETMSKAEIKQIGTVILNDLNGYKDATLQSSQKFPHYYWYKNGSLLTFPGDENDTLQVADLKPTFGSGAYTLVTASFGNCKSEPSDPKYVFFNNEAPMNINPPANFSGQVVSPAEIKLSWSDASDNELGFEIWRRSKTNGSEFSKWEMAVLTGSNVTSFNDSRLFPSSLYQYKIRAVSSTGRSDYAPAGSNVFLEVNTPVDSEAPAAPEFVTIAPNAVQSFYLAWNPSTDNTAIREYHIYYGSDSLSTGNTDTTFILKDLPLNQSYTVTVRAVDLNGNYSAPSNSMIARTFYSGLFYEHSTGTWLDLNAINWATHEFTGLVTHFTLTPKTQDDFFNFKFDGFLLITNPGTYQFRTTSDDGSRLFLNNNVIVENNGVHNFKAVTSTNQNLGAGPQRITVQFFDYIESDSLQVEYKGPDTNDSWTIMTHSVLKSDESVITGVTPDNGPEDSFRVSIFPNPASQDNINVEIKTNMRSPIFIQLVDMNGRKILSTSIEADALENTIKLAPPENLNNGIYVLLVNQGRSVKREKIIIAK
jgi:predicted esterase